jgi:threonine/homoserine/homoserine lactone efflux protein
MSQSLIVIAIFTLNVLTPGASFVLTMQTTLAHGRTAGNQIACGLASCDVLFACAAILGLATILQHQTALGHFIASLGGAWLAYIGCKICFLQKTPAAPRKTARAPMHSLSRPFRLGLSAGVVNPQVTVFFTTIFVGPILAKPSITELVLLVTAIGGVSIMVRLSMVWLFTIDSFRQTYLARQRLMTRVAGVVLIAFGLKLLAHPALSLRTWLASIGF